ncbi:hypothetical protein ACFV0T_15140 [Streptomyces sp. NPDC059582]|uniref:hypothetical protein n=1 Tax=Streptomyces sp. NPDC059582 TaxID=3346875 RepID=UPI0036784C67
MSILNITFEPVAGLLGTDQVFTSVEQDGRYPLPAVALDAVNAVLGYPRELSVVQTEGGPAALRQWLENNWICEAFTGQHPVYGRQVVIPGFSIPAEVVRPPGTPAGDVRVTISWKLSFHDEKSVSGEDFAPVELTFSTEAATPSAAPLLDGIPRHVGDRPVFVHFAAVDFGNTSSTATLYNGEENITWRIDPAQGRTLAVELAAALRPHTTSPGGSAATADGLRKPPAQWTGRADELAAAVLSARPEAERTASRLVELLTVGGDGPDRRLVERTAQELERLARTAEHADWLVPRLFRAYDRAFRVPPLKRLGLERINFGETTDTYEVASALNVRDGALHLSDQHSGSLRGLKRMLRRPDRVPVPRLGEGVVHHSDDLVALAFVRLIEAVETRTRHPQSQEQRHLVEAVITYPTTTSPDVQKRLENVLRAKAGLSQVFVSYDEGVAAGLFFVLRDFSGNTGSGVEALRAAARPLPGRPFPTWRQTMLVVDIGGGTTDIALLGLTLTDYSGTLTDDEARTRGRRYELRPEVLGSTGHPDLGGDYLTLRVYYLLKATLIDRLVRQAYETEQAGSAGTGAGTGTGAYRELLDLIPESLTTGSSGPPRLAPAVLAHLSGSELPHRLAQDPVRTALANVLPTGWARGDARENPVFHALWAAAEEAKIHLGADGTVPWRALRPDVIKWLSGVPTEGPGRTVLDLVEQIDDPEILTLAKDDFDRIAAPVFREAATIAVELVQSRFALDETLALDRIILSGRSTSMPLAKESVADEIAPFRLPDGRPLFRNPAAIEVEAPFAKQATSIGAAWAHARSRAARHQWTDGPGSAPRTSTVDIMVGDICPTLPCDFSLVTADNDLEKVFTVGTPYEALANDRLAVRSGWHAASPVLDLHRPLNGRVSMSWGSFSVTRRAINDDVQLDDDLWWGRLSEGVKPGIRMQVEIDERLEPRLHFCNGRQAHLVVDRAGGQTVELAGTRHAVFGAEGHLTALLGTIRMYGVNRLGERTEPVVVVPAWADDGTPLSARLPEIFHPDHTLPGSGEPLPGLLVPVPPMAGSSQYVVEVVDADGQPHTLDRLPVPARRRAGTEQYVSLDSRGRLRVHGGRPPYLTTKSIHTLQEHPGAVYSTPMSQDLESLYPDWNPFNGKH